MDAGRKASLVVRVVHANDIDTNEFIGLGTCVCLPDLVAIQVRREFIADHDRYCVIRIP
ncbi:hypothetical protein GOB57_09345 [Sinorhizobium meliloti]|nr:hypothetical protein [Sinorhizobium meliloti]